MMRNKILSYLGATAAALILGAFVVSGSAWAGADQRFECKAESGTEDASMDGKFEVDGDREKFSASFEAAPGGSFMAGDVLQVTVGGQDVGDITLADEDGDLVGDLDFDNMADADDDDAPFPANFPAVGAGTIVAVGTLDCSLQLRL